jgi:uncharacterized protein (TIGR02145 family)
MINKKILVIATIVTAIILITVFYYGRTEQTPASTPVLSTTKISGITASSASTGGNVTSDGGTAITVRGVCWSTNPNPTINDQTTTGGTGTGSFSSTITGLTANTVYYVRAYATNSAGTAYGNTVTFNTLSTTHDTVTDVDGNVYRTVRIGNQVWMAENLRTTKFNDGTPIPHVTDGSVWDDLETPGYCWYNNDISNKATYGGMYNWYAVNKGKLAPEGWHVPTKEEWMTLIDYLGGEEVAGGKLKEVGTSHWASPNAGATDETGFTALPSGYRGGGGMFWHLGGACFWWSATEESTGKAWRCSINYSNSFMDIGSQYITHGWSVRCVKDVPLGG